MTPPAMKLLPGALAGIGVLVLFGTINAMRTRLREEKECCERLRTRLREEKECCERLHAQLRKQSVFLDEVIDELEDDLVSKGATLYSWKAKEMGFRLVKTNELSMVWKPPKTEIYRK